MRYLLEIIKTGAGGSALGANEQNAVKTRMVEFLRSQAL